MNINSLFNFNDHSKMEPIDCDYQTTIKSIAWKQMNYLFYAA